MTTPTKNTSEKRYLAMLTLRNCFQEEGLYTLSGWISVIGVMMAAESDAELKGCAQIVADFFVDEALDITKGTDRAAALPFVDLIAQSLGQYLDELDVAA